MKKVLALVLSVLLMLGTVPTIAFAEVSTSATVGLTVSADSVAKDGTFTVTVSNSTAISGVRAISFHLNYDKSKVSVNGAPTLPQYNYVGSDGFGGTNNKQKSAEVNGATGYIGYVLNFEGDSVDVSTGNLMVATFKGNAAGTATFSLSDFAISTSEAGKEGSNITVTGGSDSKNVTVMNTPMTTASFSLTGPANAGDALNSADVDANAGYTADTVWTADGQTATGKAKASTTYTAKVTLTARVGDGESFANAVTGPEGWTFDNAASDSSKAVFTKDFTTADKSPSTVTWNDKGNKDNEKVKFDGIKYSGNPVVLKAKNVKNGDNITDIDKMVLVNDSAVSADLLSFRFYTDAACTALTTVAGSGAASAGAAPKNAGTYYVKVVYAGDDTYGVGESEAKPFKIEQMEVKKDKVEFSTIAQQTYTGSAITPAVTVTLKAEGQNPAVTLSSGTDYTVEYSNNITVGNATVKIIPIGNYKKNDKDGDITTTFKIVPATPEIEIAEGQSVVYTGNTPSAAASPTDAANTLVYSYNGDGNVTVKWYADNSGGERGGELEDANVKNVGTYWVGVSAAKGTNWNAASEVYQKFTITPMKLDNIQVTGVVDKTYTGRGMGQNVTVVGSNTSLAIDKTLTKDTDYSLSYASNTDVGTATVTVSPVATSNYTFTAKDVTFAITPATLTLTGTTVTSKVYDGTNAAAIVPGTLTDILQGNDVSVAEASIAGTFNDQYVGTGKAVTTTNSFTLTGAKAGNYTLTQPTGLTGTITAAEQKLSVSNGSIAKKTSKDLKTLAQNLTSATNLSFAFVGAHEHATLNGSTLSVDENGASGTNLTIEVSAAAIDLGGTNDAEYLATSTNITVTVTNKEDAVLSLTHNNAEVNSQIALTYGDDDYSLKLSVTNGGTNGKFTVTPADTNIIAVADASADKIAPAKATTFRDTKKLEVKGAGTTTVKVVYESDTTYDETILTVTVDPKSVSIKNLGAQDKVYDGTTVATATNATLSGVVNGDEVTIVPGTATFADKNVGTNKTVKFTGYTLGGAKAGNYVLSTPTDAKANITAKSVTLTNISAKDKEYDGTKSATLQVPGTIGINGMIAGDTVTVVTTNAKAEFADKNVGNGKAVTVIGYALSGDDAGNYSLTQPTGLTADISKKPVTITGLTVADKDYDGTTTATVNSTPVITGKVDSDNLTASGSAAFVDAKAGNGKTVKFTGYTLSGTDAGNYQLSAQPADTTASIRSVVSSINPGSVKKGSDNDVTLTVTTDGFIGTPTDVKIDGEALASGTDFAITKKGDTYTIVIKGSVIAGLNKGERKITVAGANNVEASKALTITAKNSHHYSGGDTTVKSGRTFDGGIALYLGVAVSSACGAAYVFGKKPRTKGKREQ